VLSLADIAVLVVLVGASYAVGALVGTWLRGSLAAGGDVPARRPSSTPTGAPASSPDVVAGSARLRTTPAQELAASIEAWARREASAGTSGEGRGSPTAAPPSSPVPPRTRPPQARTPFGAPAPLPEPRGGQKDNLKLIKGIGPRIEHGLNELGVYHFDQIAGWDSQTVVWVENHFSFPGRIGREKWIQQARELSQGTHGLRPIKA
jgi:NADH-quinone oxidoreductase subunit E